MLDAITSSRIPALIRPISCRGVWSMNSTAGHAAEHVAHWMQRTRETPSSAWRRFSISSRKEIGAVDATTMGSLPLVPGFACRDEGRGLLEQQVGFDRLLHQLVDRHEARVDGRPGKRKAICSRRPVMMRTGISRRTLSLRMLRAMYHALGTAAHHDVEAEEES